MKTKFKQSDIKVYGTINIFMGGEHYKNIDISGAKSKTKSGVYLIKHKYNGRLYIGQAKNLEIRHKRHLNDLKKGIHHSKLLQHDYNEVCGFSNFEDTFDVGVIIYCYPSQLTFYEHILITSLNPEYNIHKKKEIVFEETHEFEHGL